MNWTLQAEFKPQTRSLTFLIALIPLGKGLNQTILHPEEQAELFNFGMVTS